MEIGTLSSNLVEIWHARQSGGELVANWGGTRVYDASLGWGWSWAWIYSVVDCFGEGSAKTDRLARAVRETEGVFKERIEELRAHYTLYQEYLDKVREDYPWEEKDVALVRQELTAWNDRVAPFVIQALDKERLDLLKRVKRCQRVINVEAAVNLPMPFGALERLATRRELSAEQTRALKRWIERIDGAGASCSVGALHQALLAIWKAEEVSRIEWELFKAGSDLFGRGDAELLQWRDGLKAGMEVACNSKKLVLGKELGCYRGWGDHHRVFALQGNDEQVLVVGINGAALGIERIRALEQAWGIETVKVIAVDEEGGCALVERLGEALAGIEWGSRDLLLNQSDMRRAKALATLVRWMVVEEATPKGFGSEGLHLDGRGRVKSIRTLVKGKFDFAALEKFVKECAGENGAAYRYLMSESGLGSHRYARFYRAMMKEALQGNKCDVATEAALMKISDFRVVDRAKELQREILKVYQRCLKRVGSCGGEGRRGMSEEELVDRLVRTMDELEVVGDLVWLEGVVVGYGG